MSLIEIDFSSIKRVLAILSISEVLRQSGVPSDGIQKVLYLANVAPKKAYLMVYKLVNKRHLYDLVNNLNVLAK